MKIQHLPARLTLCQFFAAALLCSGASLIAGCGEQSAEEGTTGAAPRVDRSRFGETYEIVTNFYDAEPDFMPQIVEDSLVARITYTGGCSDHDFDLKHDVSRDTARVWLFHDANGDDCEERVHDELLFRLPEEVVEAPVVVLLSPQGGDPFIVKWGR